MWILGLLFIIYLTFVGFYTVVRILWDLYREGKRTDSVAEYRK